MLKILWKSVQCCDFCQFANSTEFAIENPVLLSLTAIDGHIKLEQPKKRISFRNSSPQDLLPVIAAARLGKHSPIWLLTIAIYIYISKIYSVVKNVLNFSLILFPTYHCSPLFLLFPLFSPLSPCNRSISLLAISVSDCVWLKNIGNDLLLLSLGRSRIESSEGHTSSRLIVNGEIGKEECGEHHTFLPLTHLHSSNYIRGK